MRIEQADMFGLIRDQRLEIDTQTGYPQPSKISNQRILYFGSSGKTDLSVAGLLGGDGAVVGRCRGVGGLGVHGPGLTTHTRLDGRHEGRRTW